MNARSSCTQELAIPPLILGNAQLRVVTARDWKRRQSLFFVRPKWSLCGDHYTPRISGVGQAVEALRPRELGVLNTTTVVFNHFGP
jgi:hypothetical protein